MSSAPATTSTTTISAPPALANVSKTLRRMVCSFVSVWPDVSRRGLYDHCALRHRRAARVERPESEKADGPLVDIDHDQPRSSTKREAGARRSRI
jgi:hypothetical protein